MVNINRIFCNAMPNLVDNNNAVQITEKHLHNLTQ